MHFLLEGAGEKYRAAFFEYLREVYRGKGSATDLKRALGRDWREVEREWEDHVRSVVR